MAAEVAELLRQAFRQRMMRKTGGTAKTILECGRGVGLSRWRRGGAGSRGAGCRTGRGRGGCIPSRGIPAPGGKDFLYKVGQRSPGDRGGAGHQPDIRIRMMEETIDVGLCTQVAITRQRQFGELYSGRDPYRRAGADPPRPGCATRAPRSIPSHLSVRRKLQTRRGRQRYAVLYSARSRGPGGCGDWRR